LVVSDNPLTLGKHLCVSAAQVQIACFPVYSLERVLILTNWFVTGQNKDNMHACVCVCTCVHTYVCSGHTVSPIRQTSHCAFYSKISILFLWLSDLSPHLQPFSH